MPWGDESQGTAGFVLAGGRSTRMGSDKALLEISGQTLLERVAHQVRRAARTVTIIAEPSRYGHLGFDVLPDLEPGRGPLGGLITALASTLQPWNLVVAVDMPNVDRAFLDWLISETRAAAPAPECVVPLGPDGPEPLCAMYHRRALPKARLALERNILKMKSVMELLDARILPVPDRGWFRNINTPEDWAAHG